MTDCRAKQSEEMIINTMNERFGYWDKLGRLVKENKIVIDRRKGTVHPKYESIIYPVDYGFIENTTSMDSGGIDIFWGTDNHDEIQGILCTIDVLKKDSEIKVLYNCTDKEIEMVKKFLENEYMSCILVKK